VLGVFGVFDVLGVFGWGVLIAMALALKGNWFLAYYMLDPNQVVLY